MKISIKNKFLFATIALSQLLTGCEKYLDNTALPAGTIAGKDAYVSDNSVSAIVTGSMMSLNNNGPAGFSEFTSIYGDELRTVPGVVNNGLLMAEANNLDPSTVNYWTPTYNKIYALNLAIENIKATPAKLYFFNQWMGECYFLRAFDYYFLSALYGDVALALTSDYKTNSLLARAPQSEVNKQIITDLLTAKDMLSADYKSGYGTTTQDRARPNRGAAEALLAKIYLANNEWSNAGAMADSVINDNTHYKLVAPAGVFLTNSQETIWSLATNNDVATSEFAIYNNSMPALVTVDPYKTYNLQVQMTDTLLHSFEPNDARYTNWVRSTTYTGTTPAQTFYYPNKYKSALSGERSMIMRLADILLVRAEARAHLNNITGAQADINAIRTRAGLPNTTANNTTDLLAAIVQERKVELFTEMGNRFFDLRRWGQLDAVMLAQKGSSVWSGYKQFWPIPLTELTYDTNLKQTSGY
jgi:hypothetical protein